ncbi:MAG: hypothetical protein OXH90_09610 [Paracoccaceae bacterium]|nr:hypothetical protein [Paracoccaceae bacterium]MDE2916836.1 hypothetical protein [Paracoccaceae bacterium]
MRKLIVFASALALSGSMAFAMEEKAMDEMMEAPAPSVSVGASGKIGIKNVDDGDEGTEDFKLVRAYKVTFSSSGTTDGGLMFGAGMSIRDDTGEEDMPVVKGSHVYVGGGDGSWKLQFGGNDPGIDLAGGFGVADNHFSGGQEDATIALSGSFGDTSYRITAADPGMDSVNRVFDLASTSEVDESNLEAYKNAKLKDNNWSVGVSHSINTISVGVGMDSESGLAIGVGTDLSGVSTFVYWSKSEYKNVIVAEGDDDASSDTLVSQENSGLGVKASMSAGEGATFSVGYSTLKLKQGTNGTGTNYDGTATTKLIEVDFSYDLGGGATLKAGIDKKDEESIGPDDGAADPVAGIITTKDTTTLEAAIAFSF